jgi:integrase
VSYTPTRTPGIYIRHREGRNPCPATKGQRCRCNPSWRARRWNATKAAPEWSPTLYSRDEALNWLSGRDAAEVTRSQVRDVGPTFAALADEWLEGVKADRIAKRRGAGGYSDTTLAGYERSLENVLKPRFGPLLAAEISATEWQRFVDELARKGLKRSRIANHLAVVRSVYGWAARPSRALVPADPSRGVELPPGDQQKRDRVATGDEAAALLEPLSPTDRVPHGLAFYAGLRRAEIHRLQWEDVDLDALSLVVRRAKSEAGTGRRIPIAEPLSPILKRAWLEQGRPTRGPVTPSAMSGKLAKRAMEAWGWERETTSRPWRRAREDALEPITLHECRHTYASFLMAARYTLREIMEYMGHASLQATAVYVKRLPQPGEDNPAERLNDYLRGIARG